VSNSANGPGKRARLVKSAAALLHSQGVKRTTLAQIAEHADVPPGNVYYYFKTFDDLVDAVIEQHQTLIDTTIAELDRRRTPRARLKALAGSWSAVAEEVAVSGCPIGSLSSELNKCHDRTAAHAAGLLRTVLDFIERQFRELGRADAAALAVTMFSRIQGAALLANAFGDPAVLVAEVRRIERWLDDLA
jgi:AcrR family transcriptional regulator